MNPTGLFRQETGTLELAPGDFLFQEGDTGEKMYVLLEGEIEIFLGDFMLETAEPDMVIGEMALIDDGPPADWRKSIDDGSIFSFSRIRILRRM